MSKRSAWLVVACVALLGLATCGGGDGSSSGDDAPVDAAVPDSSEVDEAVEAETHATPQPSQLTSAHTGWGNAKCMTCHTYDAHNDGSDPYLCAGCHGTNGAPKPLHGDKDTCSSCHGAPHGAEGFPDPLACRACHLP